MIDPTTASDALYSCRFNQWAKRMRIANFPSVTIITQPKRSFIENWYKHMKILCRAAQREWVVFSRSSLCRKLSAANYFQSLLSDNCVSVIVAVHPE